MKQTISMSVANTHASHFAALFWTKDSIGSYGISCNTVAAYLRCKHVKSHPRANNRRSCKDFSQFATASVIGGRIFCLAPFAHVSPVIVSVCLVCALLFAIPFIRFHRPLSLSRSLSFSFCRSAIGAQSSSLRTSYE